MEVNYLREFLVLAEGKSYLEAADILYVSQSSLSKHIKRLEVELGELLFERTTRKVVLSEYGELLVPYAKRIVQAQDEFEQTARKFKRKVGDSLTIGSTSLMAPYKITETLTKFNTENPDIKFSLIEGTASELKELLMQERCDFAFIRKTEFEGEDDAYVEIPWDRDNMAVVLPVDHVLAGRESVTMDELSGEKFLLMHGHELLFDLCRSIYKEEGLEPNIVFTGSHSETIVNMVGQGMGVSLLMKKPALRTCALNSHVKIVDIHPLIESKIMLIYRKNMKMQPAHQLFLENIEEDRLK